MSIRYQILERVDSRCHLFHGVYLIVNEQIAKRLRHCRPRKARCNSPTLQSTVTSLHTVHTVHNFT